MRCTGRFSRLKVGPRSARGNHHLYMITFPYVHGLLCLEINLHYEAFDQKSDT